MYTLSHERLERFRSWVAPHLPRAYQTGSMTWVFMLSVFLIIGLIPNVFLDMELYGASPGFLTIPSLILILIAINQGMPLKWAVNLYSAVCALSIIWAASFVAGIYSPHVIWFVLLPMVPYYLLGMRWGVMWTVLVMGALLLIAYMSEFQGWADPMPANEALLRSTYAVLSGVAILVLVVPTIYYMINEVLLRDKQLQKIRWTQQKEVLESSQKERDRFIASVSHELRTPMNAILGLNEWLLGQVKDNPDASRLLLQTRRSADHLMTVINDVLDYSQLRSGEIVLNPSIVSLKQCAQDAFSVLEQLALAKGLHYELIIDPKVPEWVELDRHRLIQVLVNLLSNAVKFTLKGSVTFKLTRSSAGAMFEVIDTGIGISEQQQTALFQRFGQADPSIRKRFGGTGLGLVISRSLVQWMGGALNFESHEGQGARFFFDLPLNPVVSTAKHSDDPVQLKSAGLPWRFLVVDDHAVNRLLVHRRLLATWPNAEVIEMVDGAQAISWMDTHDCDVVFMDMLMPVMNGVEATQRIRQRPDARAQTVIIGLTANVNPDDLKQFQQAGLDGVHLKPYNWAELCRDVDARLMAKQKAQASPD